MAKFGLRSMTQAAITSGTTQDFNISGIDQPKGALYQMTSGLTVGTVAAVARYSLGMTDGTTERVCYMMWENGGSTSATHDTGTRADTATVIQFSGTADQTLESEADHNAWTSTGSTLNWGDLPASQWQVLAAYLFGTDLQVSVVEVTSSATQDATASVTFGFRPDAVIAISYLAAAAFAADFGGNEARMSIGCAANDQGTIRQWTYTTRSSDRPASTENTSEMRNDAIIHNLTITTGTGSRGARIEVTEFTETGITITTRNAAAALSAAYMGIKVPHRRVWAGIPTLGVNNSGPRSTTALGFKPMAYIMLATGLDTVNTIENAGLTTKYGIGIVSASEANCTTVNVADAAGTSDTACAVTAKVARVTANDDTDIYALSHTSFDTTGFTVNVDTAAPADRLQAVLAFGEDLPDTDFMRRYEHTRAPNTSLRM